MRRVDTICFFGTFNPPHLGHAHAIESALLSFPDITKLLVIPPKTHVWGKEPVAYSHRVAMAKLAFCHLDPRVQVSEIENDPDMSGYSIDTLLYLQKVHPNTRFALLVGADTVETFHQWRRWEDIVEIAPLIVAPRVKRAVTSRVIDPEILFFLPESSYMQALHASSTTVRLKLPGAGPVDLDPAVLSYIKAHHLYGL